MEGGVVSRLYIYIHTYVYMYTRTHIYIYYDVRDYRSSASVAAVPFDPPLKHQNTCTPAAAAAPNTSHA